MITHDKNRLIDQEEGILLREINSYLYLINVINYQVLNFLIALDYLIALTIKRLYSTTTTKNKKSS